MKRFWKISLVFAVLFAFATPVRAAETGYKGGFFIKNDEDTFKLKINGYVKPQLLFTKSNSSPSAATFKMRSAGLAFGANLHKKTSIGFSIYHATNSKSFSTVNLAGAKISYKFIPQFKVTAGMVGLPLDLYAGSNHTEHPVTHTQFDSADELTATRASFGAPDGLGIHLSGDINKFYYTVGVVNGAEDNYAPNADMKFSTGFNVGMNIWGEGMGGVSDYAHSSKPSLTASLGAMYQGKRTDDAFVSAREKAGFANSVAPVVDRILTTSTGLGFRWNGLALQGEWYYRTTKFASFGSVPAQLATDPTLEDVGYYALGSYFVIPKKFEVTGLAGQVFRQGPDNNANQFGAGVTYYLNNKNFYTQLSYLWVEDYNDITGAANNNKHKLALQFNAKF